MAKSSDRRFAALVSLAFFCVVTLFMSRHEMWRDELEAWLAGRDSATPIDLVRNTRYNGHPITWYLLLHAVSRVTHDPRGMQLLHACIATLGVYLFARTAPFSRLQRTLFCFGYFPLFEYGVISREYVLGAVLLFGFCAAYAAGASVIVLALLAALLAQTSAYGLMMSMALAATVALNMVLRRGTGDPPVFGAQHGRVAHATWAALAIYVGAVLLSVVQLVPPEDTGTVVGWTFDRSPAMFPVVLVWRALVPVPPIGELHFWNRNILGPNKHLAPLALVLYPAVLWMLRRHRAALALFAIGSMGILTFGFIKFGGSIRHHGHIYLLLIAALWFTAAGARGGLGNGFGNALTGLLLVHVVAAGIALSVDWARPFSQSRAAARYLREHHLAGEFLIGEKDSQTAPIAAYLDRRLYFPRGDRIGSYIIYDQRRLAFDPRDLLPACHIKARETGRDVVLISTDPLTSLPPTVVPLASFTGSITSDEDYWIYRVSPE